MPVGIENRSPWPRGVNGAVIEDCTEDISLHNLDPYQILGYQKGNLLLLEVSINAGIPPL